MSGNTGGPLSHTHTPSFVEGAPVSQRKTMVQLPTRFRGLKGVSHLPSALQEPIDSTNQWLPEWFVHIPLRGASDFGVGKPKHP